MEFRPYQIESVAGVHKEWDEGNKHTLLVLPTGTGKTVVASKVIEDQVNKGERVLFLAHREELLTQANSKINKIANLNCGLEKAQSTCYQYDFPVVLGSIQTLSKENRLKLYSPDYFQTIIIDEAHHSTADSYMSVIGYFKDAKILGLTATPSRSDRRNLSNVFTSIAYEYTMARAIKEHYLSPIKAQMIPLKLDINNVTISNGDYALSGIDSALDPYLYQIADEMVSYCNGRKTLVFLPLNKTSKKFCDILNKKGLKAAEVDCESTDRSEIIQDFENGKYDILCNSMLLTEGWDCPCVDCIVVLRPTKIRSLYQQMVGRGMRIAEGKTELLLLDFLWLTERHDLCKPASLIAKDEDIERRINQKVTNASGGIDLLEAEDESNRDAMREREEALAKELEEKRLRTKRLVDPIQYAYSIEAEDLATYQPIFPNDMGPATPKQLKYLEDHGILIDSVTCCGLASLIIEKLRRRQMEGLATPKQIRYLERVGFIHVGTWSFESAHEMLDKIANNNWRIPRGIDPKTYVPTQGVF